MHLNFIATYNVHVYAKRTIKCVVTVQTKIVNKVLEKLYNFITTSKQKLDIKKIILGRSMSGKNV